MMDKIDPRLGQRKPQNHDYQIYISNKEDKINSQGMHV